MPNTYFRFKQFTVHQDKSAMKVCTDACLFGAWVAQRINAEKILDIGAGTGLLTLMLAQQSGATIDAVEIDEHAFEQASENFNASPWASRLKVFHSSIQEFTGEQYDLIISNPPFFNNDLKSVDGKRNLALHSQALGLEELVASVKRLLADKGAFAILLPFHRAAYFEELAEKNKLYVKEKVLVKQSPAHDFFRVMYLLSNIDPPPETLQSEIVINDPLFKELLKEYYL
jgi:tRNA1Val (adenine37-N6)-methyltransferase